MTIQIAKEHRRLFPLTLAPIDLLFFLDDFPDYPMSFYIELEFAGNLDTAKFDAAMEEALARHPLLISCVEPGKRGRLSWVPRGERVRPTQWRGWDEPLELADGEEMIHLREETGLRVWGRRSDERCVITMQFHHATCDGTGAYRFIGDLLVAYYSRVEESSDKVAYGDEDWKLLRHRRGKMGDLSERAGFWAMAPSVFREYMQYAKWIAPVKAPAQRPATRPFPNLSVHSFSADTSKQLRAAALANNAMLNDLLLCEFFHTLSDWNGHRGKVRLMVPSDMRDKDDFGMPAANMTAYTFVTRTQKQIAADNLLMSICDDTMQIKGGGPQQRFMDSMMLGTSGGSFFRMIMRRNWCLATAVLSNAGDPSKRFLGKLPRRRGVISAGGLTLEEITGAPPVRRKTRASLSASFYGRKLALTLRCDPNLFAPADGQRLLDNYAVRLQQCADQHAAKA